MVEMTYRFAVNWAGDELSIFSYVSVFFSFLCLLIIHTTSTGLFVIVTGNLPSPRVLYPTLKQSFVQIYILQHGHSALSAPPEGIPPQSPSCWQDSTGTHTRLLPARRTLGSTHRAHSLHPPLLHRRLPYRACLQNAKAYTARPGREGQAMDLEN